jgi:hypothetical protein
MPAKIVAPKEIALKGYQKIALFLNENLSRNL